MIPYQEQFPIGSHVRIAGLRELTKFQAAWQYHHPLQHEQLEYADSFGVVKGVSSYHGGDVLYELDAALGIWHERCLSSATKKE